MSCTVIVIGKNPDASKWRDAALSAAVPPVAPRRLTNVADSPCTNCHRAGRLVFDAGSNTTKQTLPGTSEIYIATFADVSEAKAWMTSESAWLDDPLKEVYTIQDGPLPVQYDPI